MKRPLYQAAVVVWLVQLVVGLCATSPLSQLKPGLTDAQLFEPGGLLLLEWLRVGRSELGPAVVFAAALLALGQPLLLLARYGVFRAAVGSLQPAWTGFGSFLLVSIFLVLGRAGLLVLTQACLSTPHRAPGQLLLGLIVVAVAFLLLAIGGDCLRLSACSLNPERLLPRLQKAWSLTKSGWKSRWMVLAALRIGLYLVSGAQLIALYGISRAFASPAIIFLCGQAVLTIGIFAEAHWLAAAARMLLEAQSGHAQLAARRQPAPD